MEAGYIWGALRDDEGGIYTIMRRVPPRGPADHGDGKHSLGGKLLLTRSGHGADQLELRREPRYAVHSDDIVIERGTDAAVLGASENEHGKSMTLRLSEDDFRYSETDVIDVTGTMAATPLQWFRPAATNRCSTSTQTWRVEGELIGKRVRGFLSGKKHGCARARGSTSTATRCCRPNNLGPGTHGRTNGPTAASRSVTSCTAMTASTSRWSDQTMRAQFMWARQWRPWSTEIPTATGTPESTTSSTARNGGVTPSRTGVCQAWERFPIRSRRATFTVSESPERPRPGWLLKESVPANGEVRRW